MIKHAKTDHPVGEFISRRWSPYAYSDRPVADGDLRSIFEAARWAASAYNEQPWRYIVATRDRPEEYERLLSCLVEPNQAWAGAAPVLALGVVKLSFSQNDRPNRVALHDLGLAAGNICAEATARGLQVHQMAGILPDRARELYGVPEGFDVATAIAIGYAVEPPGEPDREPRSRRPLKDFVFGGRWGEPAAVL
jgi:nitroreductase